MEFVSFLSIVPVIRPKQTVNFQTEVNLQSSQQQQNQPQLHHSHQQQEQQQQQLSSTPFKHTRWKNI
jgi:hypothetical protein